MDTNTNEHPTLDEIRKMVEEKHLRYYSTENCSRKRVFKGVEKEHFYTKEIWNEEAILADLVYECGLKNAPKKAVDKLWEHAYSEGHSAGYYEVINYFVNLSEIVLACIE